MWKAAALSGDVAKASALYQLTHAPAARFTGRDVEELQSSPNVLAHDPRARFRVHTLERANRNPPRPTDLTSEGFGRARVGLLLRPDQAQVFAF